MTLTVSNYGDVPQQPMAFASSYSPDQLIADAKNLVSQPIMLAAGSNLPRGTVLGIQTSANVVVAHPASNTGNGTVGSTSVGVDPMVGNYTLVATSATVFSVVNPEGAAMPNATVGTAYNNGGIAFTITAGGTAFVAGDSFVLTTSDTVGNAIVCVKTASDGSQIPRCILADLADATNGPVLAGAYFMGEFNVNAISYDSSWTPEQLAVVLMNYGVFLKTAVTAMPPGTATQTVL